MITSVLPTIRELSDEKRDQSNELPRYEADLTGSVHRVYGVVALQPNIEGSGYVLLLEGTSMAATESAADFVFDDSRLLPFLAKVRQKNGSLPYFELRVRKAFS